MAAAVVVAVVLSVSSATAVADPAPAPDPDKTIAEAHELSRQAEVITEEWHAATSRLQARRADADRARSEAATATATAEAARSAQRAFRVQVDRLTAATFEGVRLSSLTAMLISDSPRQFMDRMSALDMLAVSNRKAMDQLSAAVSATEQAELAATDAETRAAVAELDAGRIANDVAQTRLEMSRKIDLVQTRLAQLTADQRARYASEGLTNFPIDLPGDGVGVRAVRAALTKQGAPYIWGAQGPDTFDCSGLMLWAYRQAGVNLPRVSWDQARVGIPVTSGLTPGDLIGLYTPITHIGMYVGNGLYINAPQSGDVVKVSRVPWRDVTAVRRIG
ncbi:MAG TPA: C40 family peptidase [Pseudonocardiaceae bacterium]|nr:C40 family peptidase [Pseudonocardiaceae bacterium]